MPVPEELRDVMPKVSPAALPPRPAARPEPEIVRHHHDPRKDAREFPAYVPGRVLDPRAVAQHHHQQYQQPQPAKTPPQWWEDPVALGSLLILLPPVGLAGVWSSKRYSSDARWALTVMTALMMCLMTAVLIASIALR